MPAARLGDDLRNGLRRPYGGEPHAVRRRVRPRRREAVDARPGKAVVRVVVGEVVRAGVQCRDEIALFQQRQRPVGGQDVTREARRARDVLGDVRAVLGRPPASYAAIRSGQDSGL